MAGLIATKSGNSKNLVGTLPKRRIRVGENVKLVTDSTGRTRVVGDKSNREDFEKYHGVLLATAGSDVEIDALKRLGAALTHRPDKDTHYIYSPKRATKSADRAEKPKPKEEIGSYRPAVKEYLTAQWAEIAGHEDRNTFLREVFTEEGRLEGLLSLEKPKLSADLERLGNKEISDAVRSISVDPQTKTTALAQAWLSALTIHYGQGFNGVGQKRYDAMDRIFFATLMSYTPGDETMRSVEASTHKLIDALKAARENPKEVDALELGRKAKRRFEDFMAPLYQPVFHAADLLAIRQRAINGGGKEVANQINWDRFMDAAAYSECLRLNEDQIEEQPYQYGDLYGMVVAFERMRNSLNRLSTAPGDREALEGEAVSRLYQLKELCGYKQAPNGYHIKIHETKVSIDPNPNGKAFERYARMPLQKIEEGVKRILGKARKREESNTLS